MADTSPYLSTADPALVGLGAGSFSIAFWLEPSAGPTYVEAPLVLGPALDVSLQSDGTVDFTVLDSITTIQTTVGSSGSVFGDEWNFVVVVYDHSLQTIQVYLNGTPSTPVDVSANPPDSSVGSFTPAFQLGSSALTDSVSLSAAFSLDSVSVWSRPLLPAEVTLLYNASAGLDYPFAGGPFSLVFQGLVINNPSTPLVLGSGFQLWEAERFYDGNNSLFAASLNLLFSGTPTSQGFRWSADNFFDKIVFAQRDNVAQYWTPPYPNVARPIPGLPTSDDKWDGVTAFFNHVLLWRDDRLKWSDVNNFTLWIPVAATAVSSVLTLTSPFTQPAVGGNVTVQVADTATAVVSISLSGSLSFPDTSVGDTSQEVLTITNSGTTVLSVTGISLPSGFTGSFSGDIPVGGAVPVVITFTPEAAIAYGGAVTVASNATTGTTSLAIAGSGIGNTKLIELSGVLDFGTNVINKPLASSLVITNNGNTTLTIASVTLPTGFTGSFAGTIAAGASEDVSITFSPTVKQSYDGTITVVSDATGGLSTSVSAGVATTTIAIKGTGIAPTTQPYSIFLTDNGSCQFGKVATGGSATGTLRIYNNGGNDFKVLSIAFPDGFSGTFSGQITTHDFHDVTVTFSPTDTVPYGGAITVAVNQAVIGSQSIVVSGQGTTSGKVIQLSGDIGFGSVPVGSTAQAVLVIENVGDTALTVTSLTVPTDFSASFAGTIAPNTSQNVIVTFAPTAATPYTGSIIVNSDKTAGTDTLTVFGTGTAVAGPVSLVTGQFVSLTATDGTVSYYSVVSMTMSTLVMSLEDLTGSTPPGTIIPLGTQIFTVDANEAGETRVTGAKGNGPIFNIYQLGDFGYIFKERSIQSIQYVGITSGTFGIHGEVSGEGLLARNCVVSLNDGRFCLLGHKELYTYVGGPNLTPVCQQYTRQLYKELDRTRLYQLLMFHNEQRNEVWIQYPTIGGGFRTLVWNYVEDSATLDDDVGVRISTALSLVDWSTDPVWQVFPDSTLWNTEPPDVSWESLVSTSFDHLTIMAGADGNLRVHGLKYTRDGAAYNTLSDTMDFDLGACDLWKYVDVVVLGLQVLNPTNESRVMYVQVGGRAALTDDAITFTAPQPVLVNGQAVAPVKVNPGGSGRYLRVRFSSSDPDVQWRISSFEIHCRPGGFY